MGVLLGAFVTVFFLIDDIMAKKAQPSASTVASAHPHTAKSAKKTDVAVQQPAPLSTDAKPAAVTAEAVDMDSLPAADEDGVMATVKRDDSGAAPAPQPH